MRAGFSGLVMHRYGEIRKPFPAGMLDDRMPDLPRFRDPPGASHVPGSQKPPSNPVHLTMTARSRIRKT